MTAPKTYTLTLTAEQLSVLDRACDVYSRLHSGQFDVITSDVMLPNGKRTNELSKDFYARRDNLADCLRALEPLMTGLDGNAHHSIGSEQISDNARVAYDVLKVIRYLRWLENDRQPGWSVYGYPPRQTSKEPLATLQANTQEANETP